MDSYADTSFLFSLYVNDSRSGDALAALLRLSLPLTPLTPLHRLELQNSLARHVFLKKLSEAQATTAWKTIESDANVFAGGRGIDWQIVMLEAERLSRQHTSKCNARSLDILHIAIAISFGCRDFISFDKRQREMATLAGLNIFPSINLS